MHGSTKPSRADEAQLCGLLDLLRDLGIQLVSANALESTNRRDTP
jgi:hypothetical protein